MENRPINYKLSIVAPVYNEGSYIKNFVSEIIEVLDELGITKNSEIILVNDGSTDETEKHMDTLTETYSGLVYAIHLARNFGQASAITAGLHYSSGDCVILMDADGQDDPKCFSKFIELWKNGYDVIFAKRANRKEGILFRFCTWLFYRLLSISAQIPIPIDAGTYALIDRKVIEAIKLCPERNRYIPGLRSWVGFKQTGIVVERRARYDSKPRVGFRGLWTLAMNAFFSFSYVPLFFPGLLEMSKKSMVEGEKNYDFMLTVLPDGAVLRVIDLNIIEDEMSRYIEGEIGKIRFEPLINTDSGEQQVTIRYRISGVSL